MTENLTDALKNALNLELEALPAGDRREMSDQLLAACVRFLESGA